MNQNIFLKISLNDSFLAFINFDYFLAKLNASNYIGRSQNHSGGSINSTATTITGLNATNQLQNNNTLNLNATITSTSATTAMTANTQRPHPEYIRLSVYGLSEPDAEMKQDLCRTLQSELDYWLLIKMCNSIEKNTYKTSSAQHPDKITDEDLAFFKQICENQFDFEIPLPFVLNFNRTLRENFFFFIKQIFNSNFKAIDAPAQNILAHIMYNQPRSKLLTKSKSNTKEDEVAKLNDEEYDELATIIYNDEVQKLENYRQLQSHQTSPYSSLTQSAAEVRKQPVSRRDVDASMILLSRILFQNSKNIRIGKHTVSLVLVEAMYAVKSLDLVPESNRVARSNSIGGQSGLTSAHVSSLSAKSSNYLHLQMQQPTEKQQQQQLLLHTPSLQSKQTGPTFVFRFYCRGENDTNAYKASLKGALNEALLYFLSEYMTKIEPELYLKQINLNKTPAQFRKYGFVEAGLVKDINREDRIKDKKRHKSTGSDEHAHVSHTNLFSLIMNKTARDTAVGKLITKQKISSESQLNQFVMSNLSNNLFDHRDYQETIEYFRETLKAFDYNRILNGLVTEPTRQESARSGDESEDSDDSYDLAAYQRRSMSVDADIVFEKYDSNSNDEQEKHQVSHQRLSVNMPIRSHKQKYFSKSHLRIIYEWLRGLYLMQSRAGLNVFPRNSITHGKLYPQKKVTSTQQPIAGSLLSSK